MEQCEIQPWKCQNETAFGTVSAKLCAQLAFNYYVRGGKMPHFWQLKEPNLLKWEPVVKHQFW